MKGYGFIIICVLLICVLKMCGAGADGNWTGREYMPDMAHSQAYETYVAGPGSRQPSNQMINLTNSDPLFANGMSARLPVEGTIARGQSIYAFGNDSSGYELAGRNLVNPFGRGSEADLARGKEMYTIYCAMCHGAKGQGKGKVSAAGGGPLASIPNYFSAAYISMSEGKMFHSVQHGKNLMGSYASQMNKEDRWKVIAYIKQMQAEHIAKNDKIDIDAAYAKTRGASEMAHSGGHQGDGVHGDASHLHSMESGTLNVEGGELGEGMEVDADGKKRPGLLKRIVEEVKETTGEIKGKIKEKRAEKAAEKLGGGH